MHISPLSGFPFYEIYAKALRKKQLQTRRSMTTDKAESVFFGNNSSCINDNHKNIVKR